MERRRLEGEPPSPLPLQASHKSPHANPTPPKTKAAEEVNYKILPNYYIAKLAADEALYQESAKRGKDFIGINLRPGTLTTDPAGKVELGKTKTSRGKVSREAVAQVSAALLEAEGVKNSWIDLLDGDEEIGAAVQRVVQDGVDAAEEDPVYKL